jgi:hypothetical protein
VSDQPREIEVVSVGSGPLRPARPPRDWRDLLLVLVAVGVFLVAGTTGFTAWTVHGQAHDARALNCAYIALGEDGEKRDYDDLEPYEQEIVDALDCDVPRR